MMSGRYQLEGHSRGPYLVAHKVVKGPIFDKELAKFVKHYTAEEIAQAEAEDALLTDEEREQQSLRIESKSHFCFIKQKYFSHLAFTVVPYPGDKPMTEEEIFDYLRTADEKPSGNARAEPVAVDALAADMTKLNI